MVQVSFKLICFWKHYFSFSHCQQFKLRKNYDYPHLEVSSVSGHVTDHISEPVDTWIWKNNANVNGVWCVSVNRAWCSLVWNAVKNFAFTLSLSYTSVHTQGISRMYVTCVSMHLRRKVHWKNIWRLTLVWNGSFVRSAIAVSHRKMHCNRMWCLVTQIGTR